MKKVLSVLCLFGLLSFAMPVEAAPRGGHGGQIVVAGPSYGHCPHQGRHQWGPPPPPRYNRNGAVVGGVLARRSYWSYPYYNYRLNWYDNFYYPPCPPPPPPAGISTGIFVSF